jgi:hypothetical protein
LPANAPEGPRITLEEGAADLVLSGRASGLALLLFDRPPIGGVQREGDPTAMDAWYREFRFD